MELFPVLPEDLTGLSADELTALLGEVRATCDKIAAGEVDLEGADPVAVMTQGVEIAEQLRAEESAREVKAAEDAEKMEALQTRLKGLASDPAPEEGEDPPAEPQAAEPEPAADPEPAEPEAEADPEPAEPAAEPLAAGAKRTPAPARRSAKSKPQPEPEQIVSITAAADIPGMPMGSELTSLRDIGKAMQARFKGIGRSSGRRDEQVPVATIHGEYPPERQFIRGDDQGNTDKIVKLRDLVRKQDAAAIVAAGGLCAPVEPYYGLKQVAVTDRPVRDAMARFGAERGGIRFAPPPDLADFASAITYVSEADDASGGSAAIKATLEVECSEFQEVDVAIISHQLTFHNLTARAFPEQVDNAVANTMAMHARVAETALLDAVATGSTAVTAAAEFGASADLPRQWIRSAAAWRSRHRVPGNYTLRILAPFWAYDAILADMVATQFYRQSTVEEAFSQKLAMANLVVSWYLDTPTGGGQVFSAQSAGSLNDFPGEVIWYLYDEGGWLFLDAGALELGLVRDSVLNALNEYTMFGETFENAAFIGIESLQITSDLCLGGSTGSPDDSFTC